MISRGRTLVGAIALCALVVWGFGATNAPAAELTAVTCVEIGFGLGSFSSFHCETPESAGSDFETSTLPLNTTTEVTGKSTGLEAEKPVLRTTVGGTNLTIKCEGSELVGARISNKEPSAGKHTVESAATRDTYTGCKAVLKSNELRFCEVEGMTEPGGLGMVSTTALKGTTTGINHQVKIEPQEGEVLTKFNILSKTEKPGNECFFNFKVPVEVRGSVEGEVSTDVHSHLTFTEANNGIHLWVGPSMGKYLDTVGGNMAGVGGPTVGAETFT